MAHWDVDTANGDALWYVTHDVSNPALRDALTDTRREVLVEMAFQMGGPTLFKFAKTREYILAGDYDKAADEMLDSAWARQTPERAKTLAERFRNG